MLTLGTVYLEADAANDSFLDPEESFLLQIGKEVFLLTSVEVGTAIRPISLICCWKENEKKNSHNQAQNFFN